MLNAFKRTVFCLVLCLSGLVHAADLKSLQETCQKSAAQILQNYQPKFDSLQQQYRKSIETLKAKAQAAGDLQQTLAANAELERFLKEKSMPSQPGTDVLPVINSYQTDYVRQFNRIEQEMTAELGTLALKYEQALDRLQKELTKAGKLSDAVAIQPERDKAQATMKDYADQLAALKGSESTAAVSSQTKASSGEKTAAFQRVLNNSGNSNELNIQAKFIEKDSMSLFPKKTHICAFPYQETSDPTGPFSGQPVYFDQHKGRDVVYSVKANRNVSRLRWIGGAMQKMVIEILSPEGESLARGGPYMGGNRWGTFDLTFKPSSQFVIRIHNEIRDWVFINLISLGDEKLMTSTYKAPENSNYTLLTKLTPDSVKVGHGQLMVNQSMENAPVLIGGKECTEFIVAHADSVLQYKVPPNAKYFSATGLATHVNKSVKFKVVGDGKPLFESKELSEYESKQVDIRVKLPLNLKTIELMTDSCGNNVADHSTWAYPVFETGLY